MDSLAYLLSLLIVKKTLSNFAELQQNLYWAAVRGYAGDMLPPMLCEHTSYKDTPLSG